MRSNRNTWLMEIFRKYRKLENQLNFWNWVGRIAPLVALVIVIFLITFQFNTLLDYTIGFISIAFACIAFIWWWWVIQTIHDFLYITIEKFTMTPLRIFIRAEYTNIQWVTESQIKSKRSERECYHSKVQKELANMYNIRKG